MPRFLAETPRDQEEIDRLSEENRKLKEEIERLKKDIEEYKKRHPTTVGIKNGKAYFIMDEHPQKEKSTRNPGAQPGHRGHYRRIPRILEEESGLILLEKNYKGGIKNFIPIKYMVSNGCGNRFHNFPLQDNLLRARHYCCL